MDDYSKNFYQMLNGREVTVTITDGSVLTGILGATNADPDNVLLDTQDESFLLSKQHIVKILFSRGAI